jgi:CBS domain-containing protein
MVKNPITVMPNVFVYEAARSMRDKEIGSVIVVDNGNVLGVVTERDLVRRVLAENRDPKTVKIREVMSSPVVSISPNEDILDAAYLMKKKGIRRLIVMEGEKLVGIITSDDMTRNMKRAMDEYATMTLYLSRHI